MNYQPAESFLPSSRAMIKTFLSLGAILAGALALIGLGTLLSRVEAEQRGSQENQQGRGDDARAVRPLLAKYCFSCHGDKKATAKLNLESFTDPQNAAGRKLWQHVWERVTTQQMPPADRPQPTSQERDRLTSWIEAALAKHTLDGYPDPGPLRPRRLNVREHKNTFRDLAIFKGAAQRRNVSYSKLKPDGSLNTYDGIIPPHRLEHPCAFAARILPQDTADGGFDTIAENLSIPPFLMEKYLRCANLMLDDVFSIGSKGYQWPLYQDIMKVQKGPWPKGITTPRQALPAFLKEFATRAFRRPVTAEEVEKYAKLFDLAQEKGEDFEASIRLPLQAILVSPRFVVLWGESGTSPAPNSLPPTERPAKETPVRPLDDHELATRLSYFLWSSLPDRELFQAAEKGRLKDPEVLEQQVRRMLNDRRIKDGLVDGFLCQWLQLDKLDRNAPDADRYAFYFQNNLGTLMKHELLLFADAVLVEDRSIVEFIDADWGLLCYPLAQHYGIENFRGKKPPSSAEAPWYRVQFTDQRRGGVLAMGKVLTGTSRPLRTSPVHRGKWLLETILGTPPPPPPPDVDNDLKEEKDESMLNLTVPQRMARHRANARCASCHQAIDPLGIALETFDPVGRWRDKDQDLPINAAGTLADGKEFKGIEGLKALLLSRKQDFVRSFVRQMLTYGLGRKLEFYDTATVKQITQAVVEDDCKFSRVVVEVAKSYPFRHRRTKDVSN
jgi:mono/diheme cytochrome c family protein